MKVFFFWEKGEILENVTDTGVLLPEGCNHGGEPTEWQCLLVLWTAHRDEFLPFMLQLWVLKINRWAYLEMCDKC